MPQAAFLRPQFDTQAGYDEVEGVSMPQAAFLRPQSRRVRVGYAALRSFNAASGISPPAMTEAMKAAIEEAQVSMPQAAFLRPQYFKSSCSIARLSKGFNAASGISPPAMRQSHGGAGLDCSGSFNAASGISPPAIERTSVLRERIHERFQCRKRHFSARNSF